MIAPHLLTLIISLKGFANRLRLLHSVRGLKQDRLPELLGIPPHSYNRWERCTYVPHVEMLVKLADILQVSVDMLIGRTDYQRADHPQPGITRTGAAGRSATRFGTASRNLQAQ